MTDTYYLDLTEMSLDELCGDLLGRTMLPSRVMLQEHTAERLQALAAQGIANAEELLDAMKSGKKMEALAEASGVPLEYLKLLRREVGGYKPSPRNFSDIPGVAAETSEQLAQVGIKHTRDFYARCQTPAQRQALAAETGLTEATVLELTKLTDLARIWGVGPVFARLLYESGVDTVALVAKQDGLAFFNLLKQQYEEKHGVKVDFIQRDIDDTVTRAKALPKAIQY